MNITQTKEFLLAGNATITVVSLATDVRYTYKVKRTDFDNTKYFVSLLAGPDNVSDYTYMGMLHDKGACGGGLVSWLTRGSKVTMTAKSWLGFKWFMAFVAKGVEPAGCSYYHEGACGRCGRKLTVPESIERGIGPVCWGMT